MDINFSDFLIEFGIDDRFLSEVAFETALIMRQRLVRPADILYAYCFETINGTASYNDIAASIDANGGESVSKQAIWKKATTSCIEFFKKILEKCISSKIDKNQILDFNKLIKYKRLLVQDSTIVRLPSRLFEIFSGVANGHATVCNARIQGVYDLIAEEFISFSIDSYSKNDLKATSDLKIQKDDLCIRDRGYLTTKEIQRHVDNQADCIFRYKYNMSLWDPVSHDEIKILDLLKKNNSLDIMVHLVDKSNTPIRIIARPISEELADSRRRKAKLENKSSPSKEYLELLSWSIYVTTIPKEDADYDTIFKIYSLRWRIEIIFKNWKSNMAFDKIHNVSKIQLEILMRARFIMIIVCSQLIYTCARTIIKKHFKRNLSMLKLTKYLCRHPNKIKPLIKVLENYIEKPGKIIKSISRYCTYDVRKRTNFVETMYEMFA